MLLDIYHWWVPLWNKATASFRYMLVVSKMGLMSPAHRNSKLFISPLHKAAFLRLLILENSTPIPPAAHAKNPCVILFSLLVSTKHFLNPSVFSPLTATVLFQATIMASLSQSWWSFPLAGDQLARSMWSNSDQWYVRENLLRASGKGSHTPKKKHLGETTFASTGFCHF